MNTTMDEIIAAVSKEYAVSHAEIVGQRRFVELMRPRHVAIWLCREYTAANVEPIGRKFKRDHSTVLHAIAKVEADAGLRLEAELLATAHGWQRPSYSVLGAAGARAADFMLRNT